MAQTPEGKVKDKVKKVLKAHDIWFYMPVAGPFSAHGIPDFVCIWNGRFLGIETKAKGKINNLTPNQERVIEEIKKHGGLAIVVDDPKTVEEFLKCQTS
jgi:hypothetical protein